MKKYAPYIIAILIPIMTFVIFFAMARKRTFIFETSFANEVKAELNGVTTNLIDKLNKNVYSPMRILQEKTEIKGAFFTLNTEGSSEILRRVSNTINAYALGSDFVSSIQIVNNDGDIIVSSGRTETGKRKFDPLIWDKLKLSDENNINHIYNKDTYIFATSVNGQGKIVFFVDLKKLETIVNDNKLWLKEKILYTSDTIFFACPSDEIKSAMDKILQFQNLNLTKPIQIKHKGYIIWGVKIAIPLRDGKIVNTDINAFIIGDPKNFPLNLLQKLLLIINALIVIVLALLAILKIKNETEKDRISEYKERTSFVFNMLEESSKILDESAKNAQVSLGEISDVTDNLENTKPQTKAISSSTFEMDVNVNDLNDKNIHFQQQEDGTVAIPESAYNKKTNTDINDELKFLAEEVSRGVEIFHPNLKKYWEQISKTLDIDFNIKRFALLEKNKDLVYTVVKSSGLTPYTVENLKFTSFDKFHDKFFKYNKNLYIIENAFVNKNLDEMFDTLDKENIGELLIFPVTQDNEIIAILVFARDKGLAKIEENALKDKIVHQSHL